MEALRGDGTASSLQKRNRSTAHVTTRLHPVNVSSWRQRCVKLGGGARHKKMPLRQKLLHDSGLSEVLFGFALSSH